MKKSNLKSAITMIVVVVLSLAFILVVFKYLDEALANQIVSTYLTITTSVVGFYIGYQNNKNSNDKEEK